MLPGLQTVRSLKLSLYETALDVTCVTTQGIPVIVRGVVIFKIGDTQPFIANAARRFLGQQDQMKGQVYNVFEGHLRSIIGSLTVEEMIRERDKLASKVREASGTEMEKLGPGRRLVADQGLRGSHRVHHESGETAHRRGAEGGPHRRGDEQPGGLRARGRGGRADRRRAERIQDQAVQGPGRGRTGRRRGGAGRPARRRHRPAAGGGAGNRDRQARGGPPGATAERHRLQGGRRRRLRQTGAGRGHQVRRHQRSGGERAQGRTGRARQTPGRSSSPPTPRPPPPSPGPGPPEPPARPKRRRPPHADGRRLRHQVDGRRGGRRHPGAGRTHWPPTRTR